MLAHIDAADRDGADGRTRSSCEDFKPIATLVPIEVQRPQDRATDFAAGAGAAMASELGVCGGLAQELAQDALAPRRWPTQPARA